MLPVAENHVMAAVLIAQAPLVQSQLVTYKLEPFYPEVPLG